MSVIWRAKGEVTPPMSPPRPSQVSCHEGNTPGMSDWRELKAVELLPAPQLSTYAVSRPVPCKGSARHKRWSEASKQLYRHEVRFRELAEGFPAI